MLLRLCLFFLLNFLLFECTLTPNSPKKVKKLKDVKAYTGPQSFTPFDKGLVVQEPTAKDILMYNEAYYYDTDKWNFNGMSLGYVTPWNNLGYDMAKQFANKFTHISPVWLQIKMNYNNKNLFEVTGLHDVDQGWMRDVKKAGTKRRTKIVPRILFDGWSGPDLAHLFSDGEHIGTLSKTLTEVCKKHKFDGLVIELWLQLAGRVKRPQLLEFIKKIAVDMSKQKLDTILVISPNRGGLVTFGEDDFEYLYRHITAFSLMTYDYSSLHRPGANAPLDWVEDSTKYASLPGHRDKILIGLNFYGYEYTPAGGGPIVGREYLAHVKTYKGKSLRFDTDAVENFFEVRKDVGKTYVFYPSLYSINERITLAKHLSAGISVWELGQGLTYFFDLL